MSEATSEIIVNAPDMAELIRNLGNVAARAHAEGRFYEWGVIKASMAVMEAARERAQLSAQQTLPLDKPKRGRKPRTNGADVPASVADVAGARG